MNQAARTIARWARLFTEPRKLLALLYLPRFFAHWVSFERKSNKRLKIRDCHPCLGDWLTSTPFDPHYFYQAAWLARQLAETRPMQHVDIGSDVRMIGVMSAFVPTEFIDFRPLKASLSGLTCSSGNIVGLERPKASISSLSCLHVIEHIGLGRYGDSIDPEGHVKGLRELQRLIAPGGRLYLSVPVGRERICFNAHRVFAPVTIVNMLPELRLLEFSLVDDAGRFIENQPLFASENLEYGCGLFVLDRP